MLPGCVGRPDGYPSGKPKQDREAGRQVGKRNPQVLRGGELELIVHFQNRDVTLKQYTRVIS